MSYKLEKPYTEEQKDNFITKYNQDCFQEGYNCTIEETDKALYALEPNEIMVDGEPTINPNYEAEQELKERERVARLNLTGADVERGIYKAKGMDFDDIVNMVSTIQPEGLDIKALKIELKANNFYRGNPYVDAVGALLGFTSEQLDKFFETNDYTFLLSVEEETEEPTTEE